MKKILTIILILLLITGCSKAKDEVLIQEQEKQQPTLGLNGHGWKFDTRNDVTVDNIKQYIEYTTFDNQEPKIEIKPDYKYVKNSNSYSIEIKITDSNNVSTSSYTNIIITNEKQMSNGSWLTYNEIISLQNTAKSLCKNHGMEEQEQRLGCASVLNDQHRIDVDYNNIRIWTLSPTSYCYYDFNLNPKSCSDEQSNNVEYNLMSDRYKQLEQTWINTIKNYMSDVKNTTGYDFDELIW